MNTHTVTLEKYSGPASRYTCPGCQRPRKFSRYVDTATGQHIAPEVGRCDREEACGYHYTPRQYRDDRATLQGSRYQPHIHTRPVLAATRRTTPRILPAAAVQQDAAEDFSTIPYQVWADSTDLFHHSHFARYVLARHGQEQLSRAFRQYMFGISQHWPGATIWWQIDARERIRTGKVMLYDPATCRRVKDPVARIDWMHRIAQPEGYTLRQCLYGEHLLRQPACSALPVAVVESEKTAVLASLIVPEYLWMATGGLSQLTAARLSVLRGRRVLLYPDAGCYDQWARRAEQLSAALPHLQVSAALEQSRWPRGSDIADYLSR